MLSGKNSFSEKVPLVVSWCKSYFKRMVKLSINVVGNQLLDDLLLEFRNSEDRKQKKK